MCLFSRGTFSDDRKVFCNRNENSPVYHFTVMFVLHILRHMCVSVSDRLYIISPDSRTRGPVQDPLPCRSSMLWQHHRDALPQRKTNSHEVDTNHVGHLFITTVHFGSEIPPRTRRMVPIDKRVDLLTPGRPSRNKEGSPKINPQPIAAKRRYPTVVDE